jgi:sugar/nucleoside kinase (ribokinase family)
MYDIVTIGDVVSDLFIKPRELKVVCPAGRLKEKTCFEPVLCLRYGDKIPIEDIHYDIGGSAANVAVGLARQGFKVGLIARVGKDTEGEEIFSKLQKSGVSTRFVIKMKEIKTNFSVIFSYKGERTILVYRGLSDYSLLKPPLNLKTKWFFVGPLGEGYEKLYNQIASLVATKNIKLALNPGTIQIAEGGLKEILRITEILFVNKEEAEKILKIRSPAQPKELLSGLKKMGPEIVIITDGSEGAYCVAKRFPSEARGSYSFDGKEYLKIGAFKAKREEVTGAGDAFSSGVLGALILKKDIRQALSWGIVNSASVIEKIGAQKGLLSIPQIEKNLKKAPYPRPL